VGHKAGLDDEEKRKFFTLQGIELYPSVVRPVASRYTELAIPAAPRINLFLTFLTYTFDLFLSLPHIWLLMHFQRALLATDFHLLEYDVLQSCGHKYFLLISLEMLLSPSYIIHYANPTLITL
jgi:hypothetical protein